MSYFSTGLRNAILGEKSLKDALTGKYLMIYGGSYQPESADNLGDVMAENPPLLCVLSDDSQLDMSTRVSGDPDPGYGLQFEAPDNAVLPKVEAQTWKGENLETGVARFYVIADLDDLDTGLADSIEKERIVGSAGMANADLIMANTTLTSGADYTINYFNLALPQSC